MKHFRLIRKNFALLGISLNQPRHNWNSVITFLVYGLAMISSIVFLVVKANTFFEYIQNIFITTSLILVGVIYTIMLFQMEQMFKLMDEIEKFYDESE